MGLNWRGVISGEHIRDFSVRGVFACKVNLGINSVLIISPARHLMTSPNMFIGSPQQLGVGILLGLHSKWSSACRQQHVTTTDVAMRSDVTKNM